LLTIITLACSSNKTEPAKAEEEHHEEAPGNFVSLTEEQIKTASIELGKIELKNLKTAIRANGMLIVPNQNKAFVTALYSGVVRTLLVQPGSFVRKGQVIATVTNPDIVQLQQELVSVNAELSLAELEEARQEELIAGNAAPLKNLQQVQTRLKTLRAQRNSARQRLSTLGVSVANVYKGRLTSSLAIVAPISGTVSTVSAQIGSNVDAATPLAEIVNNSQLHLDLFVFEKDLPKLHKNQVIHFTLTNNPGKEYDAKIYSIGTAFASESKTIPIHAVVKGDKTGLIEGMNITALISIGTSVLPAVPSDAIVSFGGQDYIFIRTNEAVAEEHHEEEIAHAGEGKKDEHAAEGAINFERVQVIRGASDVGYTEVTVIKNLPRNTPVITKGAFFVLAKMTNTGHQH
ncbi:MAG TPA: efflux RND transporter periplasmic adaptor subunit, partial [Flavisolibacter sp.]|nr:efflux RND transporter periplasmic adaptor subunit [Flavisolibacter sp.]